MDMNLRWKINTCKSCGARILRVLCLVLGSTTVLIMAARAQAGNGVYPGNEAGISYERAVQHFPGLVREQLFMRFPLHWQQDVSSNYTLKSFWEIAVGDMGRDHHDPTLISAGLQLRLDPRNPDNRVYYLAGFSPTLLANTTFGRNTMGTSLEFTTQIAIGVYLGTQRKMALEFSIRHTSNGGLSSHNPGVNTLGIATVYRF